MKYTKLPPIKTDKRLETEHFPSHFHLAIFRLWETVSAEKIAITLDIPLNTVKKAAEDMGLKSQKYTEKWSNYGYITTIRNAWHLLPYEQLLPLLDMTEEQLAITLKEDDFLGTKLGGFKPYCEKIKPEALNDLQKEKLKNIKNIMTSHFSDFFSQKAPFDFFNDVKMSFDSETTDNIRMIFSYCGLYANVLDKDINISFPDNLLKMYQSAGVNAVWIPAVLYQLVPFPFDKSYSDGFENRLNRLKELVLKASNYKIKVFLYLNEPRCMPMSFFEKHPKLKGRYNDSFGALCTSNPEILEYLRFGIRTLCEAVPDLGGFFSINCSENLTHCKSSDSGTKCEKCKDIPTEKIIADILTAISEESRKVNPKIKTIAWDWEWDYFMSKEQIKTLIDFLPKEIIIQSNSEKQKPFSVGGITSNVNEYSMSVPGPGSAAKEVWNYAREKGHEVCAKVQLNVTWECSTVPFLPVFDLIREHIKELKKTNVEHLMLSWTLGGYPSINLKVALDCLKNSDEENYLNLLKAEYGEYASSVKTAAKIFSNAFREFPFNIESLYRGPQNAGPSNLLYKKPTGFKATMTCYSYDDLESWRSIYPEDIYINQLKKVADKWRLGLDELKDMPDCDFKQAAFGGYALFYSSYLQSEFIRQRNTENKEYILKLIDEEEKLALLMYELMQKNSTIGYEAANHYYFNKGMLAEKVINCEYLKGAF